MCRDFLSDPSFYRFLLAIDRDMADEVRSAGCPCGGALHSACYPRKLLGRLTDQSLAEGVRRLLRLVAPTTTSAWEPAF